MRVVSSYVCQTPGRGANGGLSSARAGTTTPGTPARAARPDSFVAVVRKLRRFIGGTSWRVGAVALFFDVAKHIGIPPAPQSARTIGSVSVRTLTARSPGGRDGWAFGNPRSDRLAVRLNVGKRYACPDVRRRVSEGPPVSPALPAALGPRSRAAKDSRGLPTITADLKPACRRKVGGPPSLPAAHESLATRVVDPTVSTAERAGGGGGWVGPWETRRSTSGQASRQPTGGRWARQSDRVSQGPTRPTCPVDRRRLGRHSFELRHYVSDLGVSALGIGGSYTTFKDVPLKT